LREVKTGCSIFTWAGLVFDTKMSDFPHNLIIYNFLSEYATWMLEKFKISIILKSYIFYPTDRWHGAFMGVIPKNIKDTGAKTVYSFISCFRKQLKDKKAKII